MLIKLNFIFFAFIFAFFGKCHLQDIQTNDNFEADINIKSELAFNQFFSIEDKEINKLTPPSLTIYEKEIVESIALGKHELARKQIAQIYPNFQNFDRMRLIFKNIYQNNQESFYQLKKFANNAKNEVIAYNVLYVLYNIVNPRPINKVASDTDEAEIEETYTQTALKIIEKAILKPDLRNQIPHLIIKDLIQLDVKFQDSLIWTITNKLAYDHGDLITRMSNLFDEFSSKRMSVIIARNHYFYSLTSMMQYLDPQGSGKHMMTITQGPVFIEILEDHSIDLLNKDNVTEKSNVYWHLERVNQDFSFILGDETVNGKHAYFCADKVGNYNYKWYLYGDKNDHHCIWQLVPFYDGILLYNLGLQKYFCAMIEDPLSGQKSQITVRETSESDSIKAEQCVWNFKSEKVRSPY